MKFRRFHSLTIAGPRSGRGASRSAFTLLELLVVVGIIALLITILLPSLRTSVRQAASTVCMHNLKQIGQAIDVYKYDNNGWAPTTSAGSGGRSLWVWFQKLHPNINDPKVLVCPEDPYRAWLVRDGAGGSDSPGSSYGMNEFILGSPDQFLCHLDRYEPKRPLNNLLIADMGPDLALTGHSGGSIAEEPSRSNGVVSWHDGYLPGMTDRRPSWLTKRHLGGINVLMIGGGVQQIDTKAQLSHTILPYYDNCAKADCTLCVSLALPHYSFAVSQTYWWTGPVPTP
jgi:prepilin-type N-terminal cleavage/methylation domain-containing protein